MVVLAKNKDNSAELELELWLSLAKNHIAVIIMTLISSSYVLGKNRFYPVIDIEIF